MTNACLFIAIWITVAVDSPVTARAQLDEAEIPFHRVTHYRVILEGDVKPETTVQPWTEVPPGLKVDFGDPVVTALPDGRTRWEQELTLTPSVVTNYTLPKTVVLANGAEVAVLDSLDLKVRALTREELAEVAAPEGLVGLEDLTAPGPKQWSRLPGITAAAVAAVAALVVLAALVRKVMNRAKVPVVATPLAVALAGLEALEHQLDHDALSCDAFFVALSQLLRAYLCASFDPAVAGQSTPEFLSDTLPGLPVDLVHTGAIRDMLGSFDRVKFAQFAPDRDGQARELRAVRNLITALESASCRRAEEALRGAA